MRGTIVTLQVNDTSIRMLATRGKRVRRWHEMPLEPELVKDGLVTDPPKLAVKLRDMLQALEINARTAIVGMSGVHCLFRVISLPQLSASMLDQAIRREAEVALQVPLEQVHLCWQVINSVGDEIKVFLAAPPRNTVESLITTMQLANIQIREFDLAPLAVSRVVEVETAIVADIRSVEADIVIMIDGVPQIVRTLPYPADAQNVQEKLLAVSGEMDRAISYINANSTQLGQETPVLISGDLVQEDATQQFLSAELNRNVMRQQFPFDYPEGFAANRYIANAGLALRRMKPGRRNGSQTPLLNALPHSYRRNFRGLFQAAGITLGAVAAVGILAYTALLARGNAAKTTSLQAQLDTANTLLQTRVGQQQADKKEADDLKAKISKARAAADALAAQATAFDSVYSDFTKQRDGANGDVSLAVSAVKSGLQLSQVERTGNDLTIRGLAAGETDVVSYASALRSSKRFTHVAVSSLQQTDAGLRFILTLEAVQ
ncbi:MAG: pilus assembly protein PilM [Chloroflexi bacterium]|nr:pilus assembly protein PilM [Chloroflexota bacterium]